MIYRSALLEFSSASDERRVQIISDVFANLCNWDHNKESAKCTSFTDDNSFASALRMAESKSSSVFQWKRSEMIEQSILQSAKEDLDLDQASIPYLLDNHANISDHNVDKVITSLFVRS